MSGYLRPTAPIAADALLVGDPGLAMALGQAVLSKPLMANHHHGLWGYSGTTAAGRPLTVQSTGIGGPSILAVAEELAMHGVARAIRVGVCDTLERTLTAGAVVVADTALGLDGTSTALGAARPAADPKLTAALVEALDAERSTVAGYDLAVGTAGAELRERWLEMGARVADRETAPLLAIAERAGIAAAAALIVGPVEDGALLALGERAAHAFDR